MTPAQQERWRLAYPPDALHVGAVLGTGDVREVCPRRAQAAEETIMSWNGNTHRCFRAVAGALIMDGADDPMLHDVLSALMDHLGVPMMMARQYDHIPAIVALFAERGVTLIDTSRQAERLALDLIRQAGHARSAASQEMTA